MGLKMGMCFVRRLILRKNDMIFINLMFAYYEFIIT